jgi:integrase
LDRVHRPPDGEKALSRAGAVKELQDLNYIWQCYADEHKWVDQYGRAKDNPFDDLKKHFPAPPKISAREPSEERVTFPNSIIREKWLQGNGLTGMNEELRRVLYTIVETGCNAQELLHLTSEKICLDYSVPHILIQPTLEGELRNIVKARPRVRAVPLVGIALEAVTRHPDGFPRYYDKSNSLSAAANDFLLNHSLRTKDATVYSLRHEYTARLRQGGVPQHIRRGILGHASDIHGKYGATPDQPDFDDKLAQMADHMRRVALPFDPNIV